MKKITKNIISKSVLLFLFVIAQVQAWAIDGRELENVQNYQLYINNTTAVGLKVNGNGFPFTFGNQINLFLNLKSMNAFK